MPPFLGFRIKLGALILFARVRFRPMIVVALVVSSVTSLAYYFRFYINVIVSLRMLAYSVESVAPVYLARLLSCLVVLNLSGGLVMSSVWLSFL